MREKPILPLLLSMALPMVVSMLVNSLYNIIDSLFVAKIGEDAITALSLVYPVQNLINALAIGFGVGINAVISYHLGAGEIDRADAAATRGIACSVIHGVVSMIVCITVMPAFPAAVHGFRAGSGDGYAVRVHRVRVLGDYHGRPRIREDLSGDGSHAR